MYVMTKSHAKNQLIWTKNGREMAVLSFLSPFGVILTPKSLPDQLWAHFEGGSRTGLGECDTPLERYARRLREYVIKTRSRGQPGGLRAQISPKMPHFLTLIFSSGPLALHQPPRDRVFLTYSCSHRPYGSNGVSYSPNPDREPPSKWAQSWAHFSVFGLWRFTNPRGTAFF